MTHVSFIIYLKAKHVQMTLMSVFNVYSRVKKTFADSKAASCKSSEKRSELIFPSTSQIHTFFVSARWMHGGPSGFKTL